MLLEMLWIYSAGAIISSLYQCLKYIVIGTLISVKAEEMLSMIRNMKIIFIEVKNYKDGNLYAFKMANTEWVLENIVIRRPIISKATRMAAKCFLKHKIPF